MAALVLTKVREVNPDLTVFTTNGTTAGLRKQIQFSRALPEAKSGTPTVKACVKAIFDREVKDSTGTVKYTQPSTVSLQISYPSSGTPAELDEIFDAVITAFKAQYAKLTQGLLPDTSFDAELDESISNR